MHRTVLEQQLKAYTPVFEEEIVAKEKILTFIRNHENCFERSLEVGHITASCWLLNKDHSKALLMHHTKLNRWLQLGGHCDGNPDTLAVAIKEAQEESGINDIEAVSPAIFDIDVHLIPESPKEKAHYHYDIRYILHVTSDEKIVQNGESKELRWISKNRAELPTNEPSVVRMFIKWVFSPLYNKEPHIQRPYLFYVKQELWAIVPLIVAYEVVRSVMPYLVSRPITCPVSYIIAFCLTQVFFGALYKFKKQHKKKS